MASRRRSSTCGLPRWPDRRPSRSPRAPARARPWRRLGGHRPLCRPAPCQPDRLWATSRLRGGNGCLPERPEWIIRGARSQRKRLRRTARQPLSGARSRGLMAGCRTSRAARKRALVALRRDLPDLPAQLRRLRRRRHRRPARGPLPPAVPARAGRRRGVDQPVLPVADGGRGVRRERLPRRRPDLRHARRRRRAARGRARAGHPGDHRPGPQPHLGRARVVPGALAAAPGSPERARYLFREGRGEHGEIPPNDWSRNFGGPAWTRVTEADGARPVVPAPVRPEAARPRLDQPRGGRRVRVDPAVLAGPGVDGFRIDVAHGLAKDPEMPDLEGDWATAARPSGHPHWDRDEVHDVYRGGAGSPTRTTATGCSSARSGCRRPSGWPATCAATSCTGLQLHLPARPVGRQGAAHRDRRQHRRASAVGAPATWVLSNHDVVRHATRSPRARRHRSARPATAIRAPAGPGRRRC